MNTADLLDKNPGIYFPGYASVDEFWLKNKWSIKVCASQYLQRFPNGPHAKKAQAYVSEILAKYDEVLVQHAGPLEATFCTVVKLFGISAFIDEDADKDQYCIHPPLKKWLSESVPFCTFSTPVAWLRLNMMTLARMRRCIVRRLGLHQSRYGELGPPAKIPDRPDFWKLSTLPGKYYRIHRFERLKNKQNLYLALAAIAPFESQIESELLKFEMHLRSELADFKHSPAQYAYYLGLRKVRDHLLFSRYDDKYSYDCYDQSEEYVMNASLSEDAGSGFQHGSRPKSRSLDCDIF